MSDEVNHKIRDARQTVGAFISLWKRRYMSRETKASMGEGIVEPTLLYGCE